MAAAATTGPAKAPRPASSIPAIREMPNDRSFFSWRNPQRILGKAYPQIPPIFTDFISIWRHDAPASSTKSAKSVDENLFPHRGRFFALAIA